MVYVRPALGRASGSRNARVRGNSVSHPPGVPRVERARGAHDPPVRYPCRRLGGYMVFETDNIADIHFLSTALAGFTFQLEPVIDVMDAVAVELQAMEWR